MENNPRSLRSGRLAAPMAPQRTHCAERQAGALLPRGGRHGAYACMHAPKGGAGRVGSVQRRWRPWRTGGGARRRGRPRRGPPLAASALVPGGSRAAAPLWRPCWLPAWPRPTACAPRSRHICGARIGDGRCGLQDAVERGRVCVMSAASMRECAILGAEAPTRTAHKQLSAGQRKVCSTLCVGSCCVSTALRYS